jgi:hypothetical protein
MESNRGPDLRVLVVLGSFINKRSPGDGGHRGFGFHWGGTCDGEGNPSLGCINASAL